MDDFFGNTRDFLRTPREPFTSFVFGFVLGGVGPNGVWTFCPIK